MSRKPWPAPLVDVAIAGKCVADLRYSTARLTLVAVIVASGATVSRSIGALPGLILPLVGLLVDAGVAGFSFQVARSHRWCQAIFALSDRCWQLRSNLDSSFGRGSSRFRCHSSVTIRRNLLQLDYHRYLKRSTKYCYHTLAQGYLHLMPLQRTSEASFTPMLDSNHHSQHHHSHHSLMRPVYCSPW